MRFLLDECDSKASAVRPLLVGGNGIPVEEFLSELPEKWIA